MPCPYHEGTMKIEELRKLRRNELERLYDAAAEHTVSGLSLYRDEILRREQSKQTTWLIALTAIVTIATIIGFIK
jgi:hypothetical protein